MNEPTNADRAERVNAVMEAYQNLSDPNECFEGDSGSVACLLADIMHWCDQNDARFGGVLATAEMHYAEERED